MEIKIIKKEGIILKVAGKYIDEDITLIPDESLFASGYTVTLELQSLVGNTVDYLTDNGLSGTITTDNSPLTLEGVTSITIPNGMIAAMSNVYIDGEYISGDINTFETFTIPITKDCTVTLVSDEG